MMMLYIKIPMEIELTTIIDRFSIALHSCSSHRGDSHYCCRKKWGHTGRDVFYNKRDMARMARVVVVGIAHHVTQRGNGRRFILDTDADRMVYLNPVRGEY